MRGLAEPIQKVAWAILLCVAFSPKRIWRLNRRLTRASVLTLLLAIGLIHVSGCGGSTSPSTSQSNGTPRGTQTITVNAADSAGILSHAISLQLTVQ